MQKNINNLKIIVNAYESGNIHHQIDAVSTDSGFYLLGKDAYYLNEDYIIWNYVYKAFGEQRARQLIEKYGIKNVNSKFRRKAIEDH